jgi:hypothetical protein
MISSQAQFTLFSRIMVVAHAISATIVRLLDFIETTTGDRMLNRTGSSRRRVANQSKTTFRPQVQVMLPTAEQPARVKNNTMKTIVAHTQDLSEANLTAVI